MPEGPSIVILKEAVQDFAGKKVQTASGNNKKFDYDRLAGAKIIAFRSWGKHFLICFKDFTVRIHLLMFGSYRIDDPKERTTPRLSLTFARNRSLNFYTCALTIIEKPIDTVYDWTADVMNPSFDEEAALAKLRKKPDMLVCDALLDQQIFSGVGNIIKNEVLFRIKVHPASKAGKIPLAKCKALVKEAVHYSFQFLEWKKADTLKKHWLAHTKTTCPRDHNPIHKKYLGKTNRRTFFCTVCQKLYE